VKKILILIFLLNLNLSFGAIPTEEGLLKNLNNPSPNGNLVTIKLAIQKEFYKIIFYLDKNSIISLAQITYGDSQMQAAQMRDVKLIGDLPKVLGGDTTPEKGLFYGTLLMLATNRSIGIEMFLGKNGVAINKNKNMINEDKMALLKSYRTYLTTVKGKGESSSPLNPSDPDEKAKIIALFKSNSYTSSKNIELVKMGSEFFWKADWKSTVGYFTNEERRLKKFEYKNQDGEVSIEANEYFEFNGKNEMPKFIELKNDKGLNVKVQVIGLEVTNKKDKEFEEYKKKPTGKKDLKEALNFLF